MTELATYRMRIGPLWVGEAERRRFETANPFDGTPWANVTDATVSDVDLAVGA